MYHHHYHSFTHTLFLKTTHIHTMHFSNSPSLPQPKSVINENCISQDDIALDKFTQKQQELRILSGRIMQTMNYLSDLKSHSHTVKTEMLEGE